MGYVYQKIEIPRDVAVTNIVLLKIRLVAQPGGPNTANYSNLGVFNLVEVQGRKETVMSDQPAASGAESHLAERTSLRAQSS